MLYALYTIPSSKIDPKIDPATAHGKLPSRLEKNSFNVIIVDMMYQDNYRNLDAMSNEENNIL